MALLSSNVTNNEVMRRVADSKFRPLSGDESLPKISVADAFIRYQFDKQANRLTGRYYGLAGNASHLLPQCDTPNWLIQWLLDGDNAGTDQAIKIDTSKVTTYPSHPNLSFVITETQSPLALSRGDESDEVNGSVEINILDIVSEDNRRMTITPRYVGEIVSARTGEDVVFKVTANKIPTHDNDWHLGSLLWKIDYNGFTEEVDRKVLEPVSACVIPGSQEETTVEFVHTLEKVNRSHNGIYYATVVAQLDHGDENNPKALTQFCRAVVLEVDGGTATDPGEGDSTPTPTPLPTL